MGESRLRVGQTYADRYEVLGALEESECPTRWRVRDHVAGAVRELRLARDTDSQDAVESRDQLGPYVVTVHALEVFFVEGDEGLDSVAVWVLDHHAGAISLTALADTWQSMLLGVLQRVAEGLAALHAAERSLGTLTPDAIRVVSAGGGFVPVLDDLFAPLRQPDTVTGPWLTGDDAYLAPELLRSDALPAPPADIFGLGVVIARVFSGCMPFSGDSPGATFGRNPSVLARRPRELNAHSFDLSRLDAGLGAVVAPCLSLDPAERPTAALVAEQLRDLADPARTTEKVLEVSAAPAPSAPAPRPSVSPPAASFHMAPPSTSVSRPVTSSAPPQPEAPAAPSDETPRTRPIAALLIGVLLVATTVGVLTLNATPPPEREASPSNSEAVSSLEVAGSTPLVNVAEPEPASEPEPEPASEPEPERPPEPLLLSASSMRVALPALGCVGPARVHSSGPPVVLVLPCHMRCVVTATEEGLPDTVVRCRGADVRMTGDAPQLACVELSAGKRVRCTAQGVFLLGEEERRVADTLTLVLDL